MGSTQRLRGILTFVVAVIALMAAIVAGKMEEWKDYSPYVKEHIPKPMPRNEMHVCDTPVEITRPTKPTHFAAFTNPKAGHKPKPVVELEPGLKYSVIRHPLPEKVRGTLAGLIPGVPFDWAKHKAVLSERYEPQTFFDPEFKNVHNPNLKTDEDKPHPTFCHKHIHDKNHEHYGLPLDAEMGEVKFDVVKNGAVVKETKKMSLNPMGPTNIQGKGPNIWWFAHVVDALVMRIVDEWEVELNPGVWKRVPEAIGKGRKILSSKKAEWKVKVDGSDKEEKHESVDMDELVELGKAKQTGKQLLQFVAITRAVTNLFAIPGGFVNVVDGEAEGEKVKETPLEAARRELMEEALATKAGKKLNLYTCKPKEDADDPDVIEAAAFCLTMKKVLDFEDKVSPKAKEDGHFCTTIYAGYCDDPRNDDLTWLETQVFNCLVDKFLIPDAALKGGDDAVGAKWMTVELGMQKMYSSHPHFLQIGARRFGIEIKDWWYPYSHWN